MSDEPRRIARRALFGRLLPQPPEAGHWVKVHRTAMACRFEVTLDAGDARHLDAARAALDEVDAIEDTLTWFRDTSEVSRVNRDAVTGPARLSPGLFTLLSLCRELSSATGGAFDPASTALSRCWGFLDRRPRLPERRGDRRGPGRARAWTRSRSTTWAAPSASRRPASSSTSGRWGRAGRSTGSSPRCGCAASRGPS